MFVQLLACFSVLCQWKKGMKVLTVNNRNYEKGEHSSPKTVKCRHLKSSCAAASTVYFNCVCYETDTVAREHEKKCTLTRLQLCG